MKKSNSNLKKLQVKFRFNKSLPKDIHHLLKRIKVSISALMKKEYE